jgi:hypothetical protein
LCINTIRNRINQYCTGLQCINYYITQVKTNCTKNYQILVKINKLLTGSIFSDELLAAVSEKHFLDDLVLQYLQRNGFEEVRNDLLKVIQPYRGQYTTYTQGIL